MGEILKKKKGNDLSKVSRVPTIVLGGWQGFEGPQRAYVGLGGPLWVSESLSKPQSRLEGVGKPPERFGSFQRAF